MILLIAVCMMALSACTLGAFPGAMDLPMDYPAAYDDSIHLEAWQSAEGASDAQTASQPAGQAADEAAATAEPAPVDGAAAESGAAAPDPSAAADSGAGRAAEGAPSGQTQGAKPAAAASGSSAGGASGITADRAKQIALNHAGVDARNATFLLVHPDYENGRQVYDVEFYSGNREYDYEIDAATGTIVAYDFDVESHLAPLQSTQAAAQQSESGAAAAAAAPQSTPTPAPASTSAPQQNQSAISAAQAKSIALGAAGVSAGSARFTKVAFDYDDGIPSYEVDFISGTMEYEFEIHAHTGAVLERSAESVYDD